MNYFLCGLLFLISAPAMAETCKEPLSADMAKDTLMFLDRAEIRGNEAPRIMQIAQSLSEIVNGKAAICYKVNMVEEELTKLKRENKK